MDCGGGAMTPSFLKLKTMLSKTNPYDGILLVPFILMLCLFISCTALTLRGQDCGYLSTAYWVSILWFYIRIFLIALYSKE